MAFIFNKTFTTRVKFAVIAEHIFVFLMLCTHIFLYFRLVNLDEINHTLVRSSSIYLHRSWFSAEEAPNITFVLIAFFSFETLIAESMAACLGLGDIASALFFESN
jgi:hypothetical protein